MPSQEAIESLLTAYLEQLGVIGVQDSVLHTVSYLAERYLVVSNGLLTVEASEAADARVGRVRTGELWLAIFKS